MRNDPVARLQHVASNLRLHRIHIVHQRGRGNDTSKENNRSK
jgi:hypothetical protein